MNLINTQLMNKVNHSIDRYFLAFLLGAYILAGLAPAGGLALSGIKFGHINFLRENIDVSFSMSLLALLLFNAALSSKVTELLGVPRKLILVLCAVATTVFLPVLLTVGLSSLLNLWHNGDELQNLLVGLALIAGMPIAGSSAAWAQNSGGNGGLSLGLIVLSIFLSPLAAPFTLTAFSHLTTGDYQEDLQEMAAQGTHVFLWLTVVLPSVLGIGLKFGLGEDKVTPIKPYLKFISLLTLILLNYMNGSKALPAVFKTPDLDFIVFIAGVTAFISAVSFGAGALLAKMFKCTRADALALVFALGMSNTGTGLVLASGALADHPGVLLPMIFYTLVQQALAGLIYTYLSRRQLTAQII